MIVSAVFVEIAVGGAADDSAAAAAADAVVVAVVAVVSVVVVVVVVAAAAAAAVGDPADQYSETTGGRVGSAAAVPSIHQHTNGDGTLEVQTIDYLGRLAQGGIAAAVAEHGPVESQSIDQIQGGSWEPLAGETSLC